ncbi:AMP-binding enzyme [Changpingibacter yushuensis]|uniref:AMP-binding enzyme n=1 Tax=Changpingibacter yushuensis TaxID=2758440 RepID=UPI0015F6BC70|nr:hypothetical protein [Changpingibacter yushuensis]
MKGFERLASSGTVHWRARWLKHSLSGSAGQRLCACIVSRDGKIVTVSELCDHFVSRNFAKFKIPEKVVMLQEMPRTSSDKVSKRELRNRFAAGVPAGYEVSTAV